MLKPSHCRSNDNESDCTNDCRHSPLLPPYLKRDQRNDKDDKTNNRTRNRETIERVNHSQACRGEDGVSTNWVESLFSRVRRSERGIHHRMASQCLDWYATDLAWKEDHRRIGNRTLVLEMLKKSLAIP